MSLKYVFGKQHILYFPVLSLTILGILSIEYTVATAQLDVANIFLSQLSLLDENTSNKTGINETSIPLTKRTVEIFTQNQTDSAPEDVLTYTRPINVNQNYTDWSSIAGVFGSAIAGHDRAKLNPNLIMKRY